VLLRTLSRICFNLHAGASLCLRPSDAVYGYLHLREVSHPARQGFLLYRNQYFHAFTCNAVFPIEGTKCASHTLASLLQFTYEAHFAAPERCRLRLSSIPRGAHPARQDFLLYRNQYFHALQQHGISYRAKKRPAVTQNAIHLPKII